MDSVARDVDLFVLFKVSIGDCGWFNELDEDDKDIIFREAEHKAVNAFVKHIREVGKSREEHRSKDENQTDIYDYV